MRVPWPSCRHSFFFTGTNTWWFPWPHSDFLGIFIPNLISFQSFLLYLIRSNFSLKLEAGRFLEFTGFLPSFAFWNWSLTLKFDPDLNYLIGLSFFYCHEPFCRFLSDFSAFSNWKSSSSVPGFYLVFFFFSNKQCFSKARPISWSTIPPIKIKKVFLFTASRSLVCVKFGGTFWREKKINPTTKTKRETKKRPKPPRPATMWSAKKKIFKKTKKQNGNRFDKNRTMNQFDAPFDKRLGQTVAVVELSVHHQKKT